MISAKNLDFNCPWAKFLNFRVHMVGALHAEIKEKGTSNQGIWLKSRFLAKIKENGQLSRFLAKPDEEGSEKQGWRLETKYL